MSDYLKEIEPLITTMVQLKLERGYSENNITPCGEEEFENPINKTVNCTVLISDMDTLENDESRMLIAELLVVTALKKIVADCQGKRISNPVKVKIQGEPINDYLCLYLGVNYLCDQSDENAT